jgi:hypothetical protein
MVTIIGMGVPGTTAIGGAGAFDVVVIAGIVAVMVAELVGETREKLQGGPVLGMHRPEGLYEFSKDISHNKHHDMKKQTATTGKDKESQSGNDKQSNRGDDHE